MYVHGTGIVDNDYNAAFDSFGHDLYVFCFELSLFLSRWVL